MTKTAIFMLAFLSLSAAARAESVRGIVEDLDPLTRDISLFRVDTSEEPRRIRVRVDSETVLTGATSVQDLKRGSEVEADARPEGDAWRARSLELLGTPDETEKNLDSARTAAAEEDVIFFEAQAAARRDAAKASAPASSPAGRPAASPGASSSVAVAGGAGLAASTENTALSPGATAASDIAPLPAPPADAPDAAIESQESVRTPSATSTPTVGAGASATSIPVSGGTGDLTPFMGGTGSTGRAETGRPIRTAASAGGRSDLTPSMGGTGSVSRATDPAPAASDAAGTSSAGAAAASSGTGGGA